MASAVLGASPIILVTHMNTQIGLPNGFFAVGDDVFLSVLGQIALMPCLVLVAKLCPEGIEASLYASFVSILNFAGIVSEYGGAVATHLAGVTKDNFQNLPYLMLGCTLSSLLPLLFLTFLPSGSVRDLVLDELSEEDLEEEFELVTDINRGTRPHRANVVLDADGRRSPDHGQWSGRVARDVSSP
jgi:hypothetical protein